MCLRPHPGGDAPAQIALFPPHDRPAPTDDERVVRIRLEELSLPRPRPWGGCWLTLQLYRQLGPDTFFAAHLPPSRKGTRWEQIRQVLVNDCSRPAPRGICLATGLSAPRWPTCSAATSWPWVRRWL